MTISGIGARALNLAPVNANSNAAATPATSEPTDGFIAAPSGSVKMSWNPQDGTVMEPGTYTVNKLNADISTDKLKLNGTATPAADGSYVVSKDSPDFTKVVAFAAAANTVDIFTKAYGEIHWAFGSDKLKINADVAEQFNANYQRGDHSVNFYHAQDPVTGAMVYSGRSGEVVAHEVGHAILDSIRPQYHNTWSAEPKAFHESFGDVTAFLATLQDDSVVAKVAAQTGGDLSKLNIASATGEELGKGINDKAGWNRTGGDWVRNLNNNLKWSDPDSLPTPPSGSHPDSSVVTSECHNFSRIWSGAVYDVIKGITNDNLKAGMDPATALKAASTEGIQMYARLMKAAPEGDFTYKDMANAFIASDKSGNGGKHVDLLTKVFTERNIIQPSTGMVERDFEGEMLPSGTRDLEVTLDGPQFGMFAGAKVATKLSGDAGMRMMGDDGAAADKLSTTMNRLIKQGDIKYTEPNQVVTQKDLYKADGHPYDGIVRWVDGQMTIEKVGIFE